MLAPHSTLTSLLCTLLLLSGATPAWSAIIDGKAAENDEFKEVYSISYSAYPSKLCTATLIHPSVLLTSARCLPIEDDENPISVSDLLHTFPARETYRSSEFGLIILAEPMEDTAPVALASITDVKDLHSAFIEGGLTVVGYGGTRTMYEDSTTGKKHWAKTHALEASTSLIATSGPTSGLSYGDHGGPAFITDANGSRRLIGVANGVPHEGKNLKNGIPEVSLYYGIRPEIVKWIEQTAGIQL